MIRVVFVCSLIIVGLLLLFSPRPAAPDKLPAPSAHTPPATTQPNADPTASAGADAPQAPDLTAMTAALIAAIPEDASAEALFSATCAACHGLKGEGNESLQVPSIAGLPDWFSLIQFEKFRNGQRGKGEGDIGGAHMAAISENLSVDLLPGLASHIAALPVVPTTNQLGGDPVAGEPLFMELCAGCHRYNGHGEKAFRSAPLSGLQDWYILQSLQKYRAGIRGYHSNDIDGIFMHRNLRSVTDEEFTDIVAYVGKLAEKYPPDQRRPRANGERDRDLVR